MDELTDYNPSLKENALLMFGGLNEYGDPCNDLFIMRPDHKGNQKSISNKTGEHKKLARPQIIFWADRLQPHGRGPMARSQHSATFFE